eukprot:EG_transcript_29572
MRLLLSVLFLSALAPAAIVTSMAAWGITLMHSGGPGTTAPRKPTAHRRCVGELQQQPHRPNTAPDDTRGQDLRHHRGRHRANVPVTRISTRQPDPPRFVGCQSNGSGILKVCKSPLSCHFFFSILFSPVRAVTCQCDARCHHALPSPAVVRWVVRWCRT